MAHTGTPWTAEEDELLVQAVALYGEVDQWKAISACVQGRTNKACRKVVFISLFLDLNAK
jgi:hypothetical protein